LGRASEPRRVWMAARVLSTVNWPGRARSASKFSTALRILSRASHVFSLGFSPSETVLLRHLCLRVVENQHQLARYLEEQA